MIERLRSLIRGNEVQHVLARGSLCAFLIQGIGALLFLLAEVVAARQLDVEQFGVFSLVAAWAYILTLLGTLGYNNALLRFVPAYLAKGEWGHLRGILERSNRLVFLVSGVIVLASLGLLAAMQQCCMDTALVAAFIPAIAAFPFQALSSLRQAVLRGLGKLVHALSPEFIFRPTLFIVLLTLVATLGSRAPDAADALYLNLVAVIVAFAMGAAWQRHFLPVEVHHADVAYCDQEWRQMALPMLAIAGLGLLGSRLDTVMLGILSDVRDVAIYAAASRIADVLVFGLASANAVVAPMIAKLHATGRHDDLQRMISTAARGIFFFTVPVAGIVVLFGETFLGFFGEAFRSGHHVLVILLCGQLVNALTGPVGFLMAMTGHQQQAARLVGLAALLNLILNALLIPVLGMVGAALSAAASTIVRNVLMWRFVRLNLGIQSSIIPFPGKPS